jgi:sterol desaturase/sphingolipid hydroxylase (fatty acid hydroxylase superfamily)
MKVSLTYKILQRFIYPFTMTLAVVLFFVFVNTDEKYLWATTIPIWTSLFIIIVFERFMPFSISWKPDLNDYKNDALYLVFIQTILPQIFVWLTALFVLRYIKAHDLALLHVWPHHYPILVQEVFVVLISDLLRYWLHRLNHTVPFLWRFHAVHHSVKKMYWLNTSRFHPIEKAMQFMMDVLPFMLLGIAEEVIALHLVLYAVNGFFQHCNIDLKYGWLNYIVSSTELHRWHHSRDAKESNNNYGNNIIIWDIVFGSFYLPPERTVEEVGLVNKNYPMAFHKQMKAPFINKYDKVNLPEVSTNELFLNLLLNVKLFFIKHGNYKSFVNATKDCKKTQLDVLLRIVSKNSETQFGKEHQFSKIKSYADYVNSVPLNTYETLSPYIKAQASDATNKALIKDEILMFNKTSGTTSEPKLIPVTKETLKGLKRSQNLMVYNQYALQPHSYQGKIVGIASPAIESMSSYNIPIGSASGHFYKNVSKFVESKYVVPYEVLEINDYELKYYVILLFCLQHKNITYIATANPTTLLKLADLLTSRKDDLLKDMKSGSITGLNENTYTNYLTILKKFKPKKNRIAEVEKIFISENKLSFKQFWPHIKLISTWTGGSCGTALQSTLTYMPEDVSVVDLGYLSSEIRATVTFDTPTQSGLPTFQDNFFEFAQREAFDQGTPEYLMLHQLKVDTEYYIFITNTAGLYRYNMNDVISVSGFINTCPLIKFIQKGKGVCNITGEKLYESQLLSMLSKIELKSKFIQIVANEEATRYELYFEPSEGATINTSSLAVEADKLVCEENNEYKEKRLSGRLKQLEMYQLKSGAFESIKKMAIEKGQSEGQYKTVLLHYKKQLPFDLNSFVIGT